MKKVIFPILAKNTDNGLEIVDGKLRLEEITKLRPNVSMDQLIEEGIIQVINSDKASDFFAIGINRRFPAFFYNVRLDETWQLTPNNNLINLYTLTKSDYGSKPLDYFMKGEFIPFYTKEHIEMFTIWFSKQKNIGELMS